MNRGWSQWGQWGQTDPLAVISDLTPSVDRLTSAFFDPRTRVARLEGQLAQARATGASLQRIRTLEGKLAAARAALAREESGLRSAALTRGGVLAVLGGAVLLLLAGSVFLFSRTFR